MNSCDLFELLGVFGVRRLDVWFDVGWVNEAFLIAGELPRELHELFDIPPSFATFLKKIKNNEFFKIFLSFSWSQG